MYFSFDTYHATISAKHLFSIIKSCILDIESCGLKIQIISTENYPLNVNLFKLFFPTKQLRLVYHIQIIKGNSVI